MLKNVHDWYLQYSRTLPLPVAETNWRYARSPTKSRVRKSREEGVETMAKGWNEISEKIARIYGDGSEIMSESTNHLSATNENSHRPEIAGWKRGRFIPRNSLRFPLFERDRQSREIRRMLWISRKGNNVQTAKEIRFIHSILDSESSVFGKREFIGNLMRLVIFHNKTSAE